MSKHDANIATQHVDWCDGIILSQTEPDDDSSLRVVHCATHGTTFDILASNTTWLHEVLQSPIQARRLNLLRDEQVTGQVPFLIAAPFADRCEGLPHLPEVICPAAGAVAAIRDLIADIRTEPLRDFVVQVFERRDVTDTFWTLPASKQYHHPWRGGLAAHTQEVAQDIAGQACLRDLERDLGIAGALLHDIGKVWSYTPDLYLNPAAKAMGHELIALSQLEPKLVELELEWPDGAYTMRSLLSGQSRMRDNRTMPSSLLSRIKACDQRSCERERATRLSTRPDNPVWTPQPWDGGFAMDDLMPF
jgi:hypothetical protein